MNKKNNIIDFMEYKAKKNRDKINRFLSGISKNEQEFNELALFQEEALKAYLKNFPESE